MYYLLLQLFVTMLSWFYPKGKDKIRNIILFLLLIKFCIFN